MQGGSAGGTSACFVDCSVYSRNRAFRLYLSSKAGKAAVLHPSGALLTCTRARSHLYVRTNMYTSMLTTLGETPRLA